jgi:hypothetical protein
MAVFFRNCYYYLSLTMSVTCAGYQENTKSSYLFQKGIEKNLGWKNLTGKGHTLFVL